MSQYAFIVNRLNFTLFATLLIATPVLSDPQETTFYDNVEWTKRAPNQAYNNPNMTINLSDFCVKDNSDCEHQIRNPSEAGMSDAEITDQSTTEYYSNENAKAIQDNFNNNTYTLDPNEDTYRFATLGIDNAYEISHGQSNQFVDCQSGAQCHVEYSERSCSAPTYQSVPCSSEPIASVNIGTTYHQCQDQWTLRGTTCHSINRHCRYDHDNRVIMFFDQPRDYIWEGEKVSPGDAFSIGKQIESIWIYRFYQICGYLEEPAQLSCDTGFTLSGTQCIENRFEWKSDCSLLDLCHKTHQVCVEGPETRTINGIETHLNCWKYQTHHVCDLPNGCQSLPDDCEAQTQSQSCNLSINGVCIEQNIPHICTYKQCSETRLLCGEESFCLDGDCFEELPTTDDSFDESLSALAALAEAADGVGDPPKIFTGQGMQCTDKPIGIANCCQDGGWGTDLGITSCSGEEKALGQAKEQGITIYLGSYCAEDILGLCIRKKKSYCVFDNKLARIIQQQGVQGQLGIGLGSAKNPNCGAISPEQLQEIDFEQIDFADFYNDMHDNANLPSADEIQHRLQSAYGS